jgi:hypothetical protein
VWDAKVPKGLLRVALVHGAPNAQQDGQDPYRAPAAGKEVAQGLVLSPGPF